MAPLFDVVCFVTIGCVNANVGGYTNSEQTEYFDGDNTFRGDIAIHRILEDALDSGSSSTASASVAGVKNSYR